MQVKGRKEVTSMHGPLYLQIVDGLAVLIFFVVDPFLFVAIGDAAWKEKPGQFKQRKHAVSAIANFLVGTVLILVAKYINADIRTWPYAIQALCMITAKTAIGLRSNAYSGCLRINSANFGRLSPVAFTHVRFGLV